LVETAERNRASAIKKLKILTPIMFVIGFAFYVGVTIFPLAGMPSAPPNPFGGLGAALLWLGIACASGGLLALFGALVVAVSHIEEED